MKLLCDRCPRKDAAEIQRSLAELAKSIGSDELAKQYESKATAIESSGCEWFWGMEYTHTVTKAKEVRYECGIRHIYSLIHDQGELVTEALETAQSKRNTINENMKSITQAVDRNTRVINEFGFGVIGSNLSNYSPQMIAESADRRVTIEENPAADESG